LQQCIAALIFPAHVQCTQLNLPTCLPTYHTAARWQFLHWAAFASQRVKVAEGVNTGAHGAQYLGEHAWLTIIRTQAKSKFPVVWPRNQLISGCSFSTPRCSDITLTSPIDPCTENLRIHEKQCPLCAILAPRTCEFIKNNALSVLPAGRRDHVSLTCFV